LAVDHHFLALDLHSILVLCREFPQFLLQELSQEEYASIHINRPDKRDQLEEKQPRLEGEQEGTSSKDLSQGLRHCTTDQVVRVLNVLQDVGVKLVVVEQIRLDLLYPKLKIQILETIIFDLFVNHRVTSD
jgi:hypothetical protein